MKNISYDEISIFHYKTIECCLYSAWYSCLKTEIDVAIITMCLTKSKKGSSSLEICAAVLFKISRYYNIQPRFNQCWQFHT